VAPAAAVGGKPCYYELIFYLKTRKTQSASPHRIPDILKNSSLLNQYFVGHLPKGVTTILHSSKKTNFISRHR